MTESEWRRFYEFCAHCKPGKEVKIDGDRLVSIAKDCSEAGMGGLNLCMEYDGEFEQAGLDGTV
jgi:hypothetical protein